MKKVLMKRDGDNIATALDNINKGEVVAVLSSDNSVIGEIKALNPIPFGNKIALVKIEKDGEVLKCAAKIGRSNREIFMGELVHVHNVRSEKVNFPPSIIREILRQMKLDELVPEDL